MSQRLTAFWVGIYAFLMIFVGYAGAAQQVGEENGSIVSNESSSAEIPPSPELAGFNGEINAACLALLEKFQKSLNYDRLPELTPVEKIGVWHNFLVSVQGDGAGCDGAEEMAGRAKAHRQKWLDLREGKQEKTEPYIDRSYLQPRLLAEDGNFIAYDNGIVSDSNTRLDWLAGPDVAINWHQARYWVKNLVKAGGGWRMPTIMELQTLYSKDRAARNMTSLLQTTGWWIWSGESHDSATSWLLNLENGQAFWFGKGENGAARVFAVREKRRKNF